MQCEDLLRRSDLHLATLASVAAALEIPLLAVLDAPPRGDAHQGSPARKARTTKQAGRDARASRAPRRTWPSLPLLCVNAYVAGPARRRVHMLS
jgi:hypothetical protein